MKNLHTQIAPTQREPLDERQVKNNAGGFVYSDPWLALDRFLILGTEGGTYYVSQRELTRDSYQTIRALLKEDGVRVVRRTAEISKEGRAAKNDYALFVLALAFAEGNKTTKWAAQDELRNVARTGTHLFIFLTYAEALRGWGRVLRDAVADWYNEMPAERLSYQMLKYRQRHGWTHRDVLRLAHPKPVDQEHDALYAWAVRQDTRDLAKGSEDWSWAVRHLWVDDILTGKVNDLQVPDLVRKHRLTREMVQTKHLASPRVMDALLDDMPYTALLRNLANLTRLNVLKPLGARTKEVVERLTNEDNIRAAKVHPVAVLAALCTYRLGGKNPERYSWEDSTKNHFDPIAPISEALDEAVHLAFQNVEPSNARILLALDVSGSMGGHRVGGTNLTAREGAAVMALTIAKREPNYHIVGFTSGAGRAGRYSFGTAITPLAITAGQTVDQVVQYTGSLPFGGTDCALPMHYAMEKNLEVDTFVVLTDSETWAGGVHPMTALREYRKKSGIEARMVVVGMASAGFTIADPADPLTLDVAGFDTATPRLLSDFAAGKL